MSPTATIARDLREAEMMRRCTPDSYQKYHQNLAAARERAAKYREQKR